MLKRLLRSILLAPLAVVLLFEEWGWAPLAALFARLARLPLWAWLERKVAALIDQVHQAAPWRAARTFKMDVKARAKTWWLQLKS
ncbi:hypothetical protein [Rhodoferax sp.]|uniref:hypothetical protein n=1 Tax=Rhodoferax sp. TaxID=50421 RepID=UPI002751A270|nr:hypothetical protein [Rhodoferax sp.]